MTQKNSKMTALERAVDLIKEFGTKELAIKACIQIKNAPYLDEFQENVPEDTPDGSVFWDKYDLYWDDVISEIEKSN